MPINERKDICLYWQKSAQLDGQISWNSMTHPLIQQSPES